MSVSLPRRDALVTLAVIIGSGLGIGAVVALIRVAFTSLGIFAAIGLIGLVLIVLAVLIIGWVGIQEGRQQIREAREYGDAHRRL